jgi:large subunit ribosomal protein L35
LAAKVGAALMKCTPGASGDLRYPPPSAMPKMKTHSGAKKRFKLTANGKVRGRHAFSSHILEKKSPKRKRGFRRPVELTGADAKRIKKLLGETK